MASISSPKYWTVFFWGLLLVAPTAAQTWPPGFHTVQIGGGWNQPVAIAYAGHDDLLVAEKSGLLWNVSQGARQLDPVVDLRQEVLDRGDRGLISVLADPDFEANGYIYLLYIVDPDQDFDDSEQEAFGRLTRYTTFRDIRGNLVADPLSRHILIGPTWSEGIPSLHLSHAVGQVLFAKDGSLLLSTGDGAHYDFTDFGGADPNGFGPGKFDASEDIGAFRSQSLTSLAGKILRIDPLLGQGYSDNPFFTGDPTDAQSKVWALGLRNPFRIAVDPLSGDPVERLFIGDVGWGTWEEIDKCQAGDNFGWPCREGAPKEDSYFNGDPYGYCGGTFKAPKWSYHHTQPRDRGYVGQSIAGMHVYTGSQYPVQYHGRLFFCDYSSSWLRTVRFVGGQPTEVELFGNGIFNPVDLTEEPESGDLVVVSLGDQKIYRIRYSLADLPPVISAQVSPTFGAGPLQVDLDASGSVDPEGGGLSYWWDLGDGNASTAPALTHTFQEDLNHTVTLTVSDASGNAVDFQQMISVGNTPPQIVSVDSPADGLLYQVGDTIDLSATADDLEDGAAAAGGLSAEWHVNLIHDHHTHPDWAVLHGFDAQYSIGQHGDGTHYEITLVVKDSRGLSTEETYAIYDAEGSPQGHWVAVSDESPRMGEEVQFTCHAHFPGLGKAKVTVHYGDGSHEEFSGEHMEDFYPVHTYAAPGTYYARLESEAEHDDGHDHHHGESVVLPIFVGPQAPAVAVFAPGHTGRWIKPAEQWTVGTQLIGDLRAAGWEAEFYNYANQEDLEAWMLSYLDDGHKDYLVCLDMGAALVYRGQNESSLAEAWLDAGNGLLWSGYTPFARYVWMLGGVSNERAGGTAADEVLDAAVANLCWGDGHQYAMSDQVDLPSWVEADASRAVRVGHLGSEWSVAKLFSSDREDPAETDGVLLRHSGGGEYAQFYCVRDPTLPRRELLREFFLSQLYAPLPPRPTAATPRWPRHAQSVQTTEVDLQWDSAQDATSYLLEVATDAEFEEPVVQRTLPAGQTVEKVFLEDDHLYYWRVTARNDLGATPSAGMSFFTGSLRFR
jgi:glucose/arabinose dehydrogenase